MPDFFQTLKERRLVQWALGYLAVAFGALQLMDALAEPLGLGPGAQRVIVAALAIGLIVVILAAWFGGEPSPRKRSQVALALGGLLFVGVGAVVFLPRMGSPGVSDATSAAPWVAANSDVIAVFPFRTSAPGLDHLEEGLMDLVSRGLGQVDAIATLDPRTIMRRVRRFAPAGELDLEESLALAREVGATSALLGSVVAAGPQVRLDAALYPTDGSEPTSAQATGSPDSLLAITDRLVVALVQRVWESGTPIPNLDVSAVTTSSPEALRSFLEGERLYRLADLRGARTELEQAVRLDSTFALAHHRLAWALAWSGGLGGDATIEHLQAAARHADRLPQRERTLVEGFLLLNEERYEVGYETLLPYVRQWPDDPEAWFVLANHLYHHPQWMGRTTQEILEPFDRTLALDSTLAMAYVHPLQVSLCIGDPELYRRYMDPLRRLNPTAPRVRVLERRATACFGPENDCYECPAR